MKEFWNYKFYDTPEFIETFDEAPLWSAAFGLLLLKHVPMRQGIKMLDLGSGAGFPLFEMAERLGPESYCYGIDTWSNANRRAGRKIAEYNVDNVEIIECAAEQLPFENDSIDLIVSNLGINNFENPAKVFTECAMVLKSGSQLVLTTNINGHWKEFYKIFESTVEKLQHPEILHKIKEHQLHRGTVESVSELYTDSGFKIAKIAEENYEMRYLNGTAFLNHHFVKLGWLTSWVELVPANLRPRIFMELEKNLNAYSVSKGELKLSVPMLYMEGVK